MKKVTVYTQTGCNPCTLIKEWFVSNNIQFDEKNINENSTALEEFEKLDLQFTPVTVIESEEQKFKILGLDKGKIEKVLKA